MMGIPGTPPPSRTAAIRLFRTNALRSVCLVDIDIESCHKSAPQRPSSRQCAIAIVGFVMRPFIMPSQTRGSRGGTHDHQMRLAAVRL
ncbi:hypothetical protein C8Q79DRAFT_513271 [Trametes meyenii]|nr:hypothetical protein C8Q79DRAFT_513271 [Trametes meyenii]